VTFELAAGCARWQGPRTLVASRCHDVECSQALTRSHRDASIWLELKQPRRTRDLPMWILVGVVLGDRALSPALGMRSRTHARTRACTRTHARMHARTHMRLHTNTAHARAHTHMRTLRRAGGRCLGGERRTNSSVGGASTRNTTQQCSNRDAKAASCMCLMHADGDKQRGSFPSPRRSALQRT
jgi:hypothetical protein